MAHHTATRHVSPRKRARRPRNEAAGEVSSQPIVQRPDGYHWIADGTLGEFGPFETYEVAQADRDAVGDEAVAPNDALQEAEHEIGMNDWLDAESGEPAEGESPPHLREE